jgi:hypothetical protein
MHVCTNELQRYESKLKHQTPTKFGVYQRVNMSVLHKQEHASLLQIRRFTSCMSYMPEYSNWGFSNLGVASS